jgi:hypothetical protein
MLFERGLGVLYDTSGWILLASILPLAGVRFVVKTIHEAALARELDGGHIT